MRFEDIESRNLARHVYGDMGSVAMDEAFLKNQGEYVNRAREWKRSHATKHAWRKHRHHFMRGIHAAMRCNQGKLLRGSIVGDIKRDIRESKTPECVSLVMHEHKRYEFLRKLSLLESLVFKGTTYYMIEESYVEASLLAEEACKAMMDVKRGVLTGKDVPMESVELVLSVCGEDAVNECSCRRARVDESLLEVLMEKLGVDYSPNNQ